MSGGDEAYPRPPRPQRALLDRIQAHAEASPEIAGLLLFGSLATGTEDEHSDLDLGLYLEDGAWATFDLRRWMEQVAPVVAVHVDEHCSTVIFADLIRAEIHLGPTSAAGVWAPLAGEIAYPSLERMVLFDRTGAFRTAVAPLIGQLPDRSRSDGEREFVGLVNWLLVADGCRRRGHLVRALVHLASAHRHLLRLARLEEEATNEWIAPERGVEVDLSSAAYARYAAATAGLEAGAVARAIEQSWRWGRELAELTGVRPIGDPALAALDRRFFVEEGRSGD
jgi:predicted nucleotidyltransferase